MNYRIIYIIIGIVFLHGCATTCDPSQGGFFDGVSCLSKGEYEERVKQREANLAAMEDANRQQDTQTGSLQVETASLEANLATQKRELGYLKEDINQLSKDADNLVAKNTADKKKIKVLKEKLARAKKNGGQLLDSDVDNLDDLVAKEKKKKQLEQEYQQLLELYLNLEQ